MINQSVGQSSKTKIAKNAKEDVLTVQKILNRRFELLAPLRRLMEDGVITKRNGNKSNTQSAIKHVQKKLISNPDGRIDPFGSTIKKLWPLKYSNPTGKKIRGTDSYGAGHHGAPRGPKTHDGSDYESIAGQQIKAPLSGKIVSISKPYLSGTDAAILSGLHIIASDGTKCWIWYLQPKADIVGQIVQAGEFIGISKTLKNRYPGITDHVHVRIHGRHGQKINPATVIR